MNELIVGLLGALIGAGPCAILLAVLQRRWAKQDKLSDVVKAQKLIMLDRVKFLGKQFILAKGISLEDKELLEEMYRTYKSLGGNGHLDTIMHEVSKLPIIE